MPSFEVRVLTPNCGSDIIVADIRTFDDADIAAIKAEVSNRCVVVMRGQHLSPNEQATFASRFGTVLRPGHVPNHEAQGVMQLRNTHEYVRAHGTDNWHTDATHERSPPSFTMLSADAIPACGGDTMWANQYLAYETLSASMKKLIEPLKLGFVIADYYRQFRNPDDPLETFHPLVRVHPITGRRSLYISDRRFVSVIEGMTEEESRPITEFLHRHSQQPEHIYRHRWTKGDLVIWDNRCALHYAVRDYSPNAVRNMNRIMVTGEAPISVAEREAAVRDSPSIARV